VAFNAAGELFVVDALAGASGLYRVPADGAGAIAAGLQMYRQHV